MKGTVKWFDDQRGYGFILGGDGKEYFVHYTNIISSHRFKKFMKDDTVEFDVEENEKGEYATNAHRIENGEEG